MAPSAGGSRGYPLLVMGMHRSGTTLVARTLQGAGVHMGADCNAHGESAFFREWNKWIFRAGHADWDWPEALRPVLEDEELCEALAAELRRACGSPSARRYLGWGRWVRGRRLPAAGGPWGWKDPRTTCTLPVWRRVFPDLRVVNVYRNGVDVAASLVERERGRRGRVHNPVRSSRCLDPERAFALWAEYVEASLRVTEELSPRQVRDVRYESFVARPETQIPELLDFVGLPWDEARIRELAAPIDPQRAGAARRDPEWKELARARADHPLMRHLDYGDPWP